MDAPVDNAASTTTKTGFCSTDPDVSGLELQRVVAALRSPRLSAGSRVEDFEAEFASLHGPRLRVATASGTLGIMAGAAGAGDRAGDEVVKAWQLRLAPDRPRDSAGRGDADLPRSSHWSAASRRRRRPSGSGPATKALIGNNCNGHPAAWKALRELAARRGIAPHRGFDRGHRFPLPWASRWAASAICRCSTSLSPAPRAAAKAAWC